MTYSFNLLRRPWIPCTRGSEVVELSLRDTLARAHELHGIAADSPLETAALYRLLLAVLHSVLRGPVSQAAWIALWEQGYWDMRMFDAYFEKWEHRFDLFDTRHPFYQERDPRVERKAVIALVPHMASGNNATLFDHHTEEEGVVLTAAEAARSLLVSQAFGLAGLSGIEQKHTDAPWTRGIIFLLEGDSLFETLMLNLLRYPYAPFFPTTSQNDAPAWEMDSPCVPERNIPYGYLDYLTWYNRRVWLIPEGETAAPNVRLMTLAPALRLDKRILDPFKHYQRDAKAGYQELRFSEERALWRDSAALFRVRTSDSCRPPHNFAWLAALTENGIVEPHRTYRFMALGMANNQAKIDFLREEHWPLPLEYLRQETLLGQLASALERAEEVGRLLWQTTCQMALLVIAPRTDGQAWGEVDRLLREQATALCEHWGIESRYWGSLERPFLEFIEDLPERPNALEHWEETVADAAHNAFAEAQRLAGDSAAALRAAVRVGRRFDSGLRRHVPTILQEVMT